MLVVGTWLRWQWRILSRTQNCVHTSTSSRPLQMHRHHDALACDWLQFGLCWTQLIILLYHAAILMDCITVLAQGHVMGLPCLSISPAHMGAQLNSKKQSHRKTKLHCGPWKNMALYFCQYLRRLLTNFQNSLTFTLCRQFAIMWSLYIPPHGKCVSTLPWEI